MITREIYQSTGPMDQNQAINLYAKGRGAWNRWAERLLIRKQKLIDAGMWHAVSDYDFEQGYHRTRGLNEATRNWLNRAFVDFSNLTFRAEAPGANRLTSKTIIEPATTTHQHGSVSRFNIDFKGFIFPSDVRFDASTFNGIALFNDAEFNAAAWFNEARFLGASWFKQSEFKGAAGFHQVEFNSFTTFQAARFNAEANFEAIQATRGFNLADVEFTKNVPNFIEARITEAPRLDNIQVLPPPKIPIINKRIRANLTTLKTERRWRRKFALAEFLAIASAKQRLLHIKNKFINARRNPADEAHYRALKQLAKRAETRQEQRGFFASEMRARRHITDKLKDFPSGATRYLTGLAYELTSDFGRSIWRPVACWVAVFYLFTGLYLAAASNPALSPCHNDESVSPFEAAKTIAFKNTFLLIGDGTANSLRSAASCLYSTRHIDKNDNRMFVDNLVKDQTRLAKMEEDDLIITASLPEEPPNNVSILGTIHTLLHLVLITMLLLVLRNHFKLK